MRRSKSTSKAKSTAEDKTPSFICELPLRVSPGDEKVLLSRLEAARQVYNACLGEALKRLRLLRQSRLYQKARRLDKGWERTESFKEARSGCEFSNPALQRYAVGLRRSWIGAHLDVHTTQKIATRAFQAVEQHAYGKRGRPRFKGKNQLDSVESKSNTAGIRWRENRVEWKGLTLPALIDLNDPIVEHGLSSRVKYVRLVRRQIRGRNRFYAQLICEGRPYQKTALGTGTVGLDVGPSTVAVVGEDAALLEQFCAELDDKSREVRRIQRRLDRRRRANNPDNCNPDGTIKPGPKKWRFSNRYRETKAELAETHRRLAAHRKTLHGQLVNKVLQMGDTFLLEEVSYRSFQRNFGKSAGFRAPGLFALTLCRKAESAGGKEIEFPTRNTKLSQACHCGQYKKKRLSDRVHVCDCGVIAQRDLYSAHLARHVDRETHMLHAGRAFDAWPGAEPLGAPTPVGRAAWQRAVENQPVSGRVPSSFGSFRSQSGSSAEGETVQAKIRDVVAAPLGYGESPGEARAFLPRTPRL